MCVVFGGQVAVHGQWILEAWLWTACSLSGVDCMQPVRDHWVDMTTDMCSLWWTGCSPWSVNTGGVTMDCMQSVRWMVMHGSMTISQRIGTDTDKNKYKCKCEIKLDWFCISTSRHHLQLLGNIALCYIIYGLQWCAGWQPHNQCINKQSDNG